MDRPILVGAVLYDPKVSVIWDIIRDFFEEHRITKASGGVATLEDLRGITLAVGAKDSPQATLIPLRWLQCHGLEPGRDFQVRRFDVLIGKHGDHVGGELQAWQCLAQGGADASALLDLNWERWIRDGTIDRHAYRILTTTAPFDHCCFTVRADFPHDREHQFVQVLFAMRYDDPRHREMMDMEGLKAWVPGRTTGYALLREADPIRGMLAGSTDDHSATTMSDAPRR